MSGKLLAVASLSVLVVAGCASADEAASSANAIETRLFLAPSAYADVLVVDPAFPFGVIARHAVTGGALGARWGAHGGPAVTAAGDGSRVLRYGADGVATTSLASVVPSGLPVHHFWGVDGFVDVPFAGLSLRGYTTSNDPFAGELLFFGADLATVRGRANVNGFYSGLGIQNGDASALVYSGLSGLGASPTAASDNGLWTTKLCGESTGTCAPSTKLLGWNGLSGPVAADADGNVFVAAFVSGGAHSDAVYGATRQQAFAGATITPAPIGEFDTSGTSSFVALGTSGAGWLLGKGYDGDASVPIWAQPYRVAASGVVAGGVAQRAALTAASNAITLSLFSAPDRHLWIAAEGNGASTFLELAAK